MRFWHDLLDSLDSGGGHIVVLLILILIGFAADKGSMPEGKEIMIGAFGALLLMLKETGSNRERTGDTTTTKVEEVKTQPEVKEK